jgi:hypothetical protein
MALHRLEMTWTTTTTLPEWQSRIRRSGGRICRAALTEAQKGAYLSIVRSSPFVNSMPPGEEPEPQSRKQKRAIESAPAADPQALASLQPSDQLRPNIRCTATPSSLLRRRKGSGQPANLWVFCGSTRPEPELFMTPISAHAAPPQPRSLSLAQTSSKGLDSGGQARFLNFSFLPSHIVADISLYVMDRVESM